MATYGKKLLDINGNVILPKTRSSLVYMDNNETVEDKIGKILESITANGNEITNIKNGTTTTNANKILGNSVVVTKTESEKDIFYITDSEGQPIPYGSAFNDQNQKNIAETYMPKSGGSFTGGVSAKMDVSVGSGVYLHNIHIPNVKTNIHYIILWT